MQTLSIGIIGAGYWGEQLIRVFNTIPGVRVRGVYDQDSQRLSAHRDIPTSTDIGPLLQRADIDTIVIATPPSSHFELAKQVLEAGKHCWVEKPLALRAADARELVGLAAARQRTLFVDETFLYDPLVQRAKQWIEAGRLGRLFHLSFERLGMGRVRRDSNVWWNSAPHDLSILCHLVPGDVERMHVESFAYLQPGIADMAVATVQLSGGISAHLYLSWLSPLKAASMVVVGSHGMLHFEGRFAQRALRFFEYRVGDPATLSANVLPIEQSEPTEVIAGGSEEPLLLAARAFVESIRSGIAAPSAGEYSQRVVELLEAGEAHTAL